MGLMLVGQFMIQKMIEIFHLNVRPESGGETVGHREVDGGEDHHTGYIHRDYQLVLLIYPDVGRCLNIFG